MAEPTLEDKRKKEIQNLHKAFETFNNASEKLQNSYDRLKERVKELDAELEKKNAELKKNLREKDQVKNHLRNILESLNTGVVVVNPDGRISAFNKCAADITGYRQDETVGRSFREVFPGDLVRDALEPLLDSPDPANSFDRSFRSRDDRRLDIRLSASPMIAPKEGQAGAVLIIQDVTWLKNLEEEVQRNQRLTAMGEMAAGIAHEIRNPLGSIELFASLLRKDLEGDQEKALLADHIGSGGKNMDRIISSILLFAKSPQPSRRRCDVNDLLKELLEFSSNILPPENIRIVRELAPDNPMVNGDEDLLRQVVLIFIRNSIQAMPEGGELSIVSRKKPEKVSKDKNAQNERPYVEIVFADTGHGISEENLAKIFNPFFTTKARGTGLGMAIAYNIIKAHSGAIEVESREGQGTRFVVKLPAWNE